MPRYKIDLYATGETTANTVTDITTNTTTIVTTTTTILLLLLGPPDYSDISLGQLLGGSC